MPKQPELRCKPIKVNPSVYNGYWPGCKMMTIVVVDQHKKCVNSTLHLPTHTHSHWGQQIYKDIRPPTTTMVNSRVMFKVMETIIFINPLLTNPPPNDLSQCFLNLLSNQAQTFWLGLTEYSKIITDL